jgi:hypothetical protein
MGKNKRIFQGIPALVFALALSGCGGTSDSVVEGYTFKFKAHNNSQAAITKIQFINGSNRSGFVLREPYGIHLANGELSGEYRVSGFTEEYGTNERYCGVIIAYDDGTDIFGYWHSGHESKILITSSDDYWTGKKIVFSHGSW